MNRYLFTPLLIFLLGCASSGGSPVSPSELVDGTRMPQTPKADAASYHSWGFYLLGFDESHTSCRIVPLRQGTFHLNALKFLEDGPCGDCVSIESVTPKGDGVIDVDIRITHPFQSLVYSAFDVKGIIMFTGSLEFGTDVLWDLWPQFHPAYIGWWRRGDWELLNPDGWTFRWGPRWNPDGQYPIEKYWPGKFSKGTPTADINGYKNFYTDEERHLFRPNHYITQTYEIKTQPGPLTVGYAVEACWEPPVNVPIVNPLTDFPPSANQPEPYLFSVVVNDGKTVEFPEQLYNSAHCPFKVYINQWADVTVEKVTCWRKREGSAGEELFCWANPAWLKPSIHGDYYCGISMYLGSSSNPHPQGWYRTVYVGYWGTGLSPPPHWHDHAITVTDFLFDIPDD